MVGSDRWRDDRRSLASLVASVGLLLISPEFLSESAIFLFADPALISIPIGFLASYLGTILSSEDRERRTPYEEIYVRSNVGSGEEA